jgi:hypothetical protein
MTQATDTDIRDIKTAIDNLAKTTESIAVSTEANTKAITDLTLEVRVGLTKLDGDVRELRAEIGSLDAKFDERTKVGFWGFILRGTVLAIIIGVGGYLLPILAEYVHKIPSP